MKPTSLRMLVLVALVMGAAGWMLGAWLDDNGRLPVIPWLAVAVIWVVCGFIAVWALVARKRLHAQAREKRMSPLVAARTAALALAGSRTGAVVFGLYAGLAGSLADDQHIPAARERVLAAGLAALGGLVLCGLSLWLEHICRLPDDPEGGQGSATVTS